MIHVLQCCLCTSTLSGKGSSRSLPTQIEELHILKEKTPKDLWKEDITAFMEELEVYSVDIISPAGCLIVLM